MRDRLHSSRRHTCTKLKTAMEPTGASSTTVQTGFLKHSLQYQTRSLVLTKSSQHPDAVICESGSESWQPQLISLVLYNHTNNRGR